MVLTSYNDNIDFADDGTRLTYREIYVDYSKGFGWQRIPLVDEANQDPVTLSCNTVDSVQSTPHTLASRCLPSDRNSTFL